MSTDSSYNIEINNLQRKYNINMKQERVKISLQHMQVIHKFMYLITPNFCCCMPCQSKLQVGYFQK